MKRTATKDDTLKSEFLHTSDFESFNMRELGIKFAIGYAWYFTGFVASFHILTMTLLLTNIVWLQYVIMFATLAITLIAVAQAAPVVIDGVYAGGVWATNKAKVIFANAKAKFNAFEMPAFATKH